MRESESFGFPTDSNSQCNFLEGLYHQKGRFQGMFFLIYKYCLIFKKWESIDSFSVSKKQINL